MAAPIIIPDVESSLATLESQNEFWDTPPAGAVDSNGALIVFGEGQMYPATIWDSVWLSGLRLPGVCTVKCESSIQIDQQKGAHHDGAVLIIHGVLPCPVEVSVKIWTAAQFAVLEAMLPKFYRKPDKGMTQDQRLTQLAISFHAPVIPKAVNVEFVVVKGISSYEVGPEPNTKILRIRCIQHLPPTKKTPPSKVKQPTKVAADERVVTQDPPSKTAVGPTGG